LTRSTANAKTINKEAAAIARILARSRRILITAHQDPDGDSLGCQLAFYEYWTNQKKRKADVVNHGAVPSKYMFMDPKGLVKAHTGKFDSAKWEAVVVFECSSLDRTGEVERLIPKGIPVINIDHHQKNTAFGDINVLDTSRAACGELLYELLLCWKAKITPSMAQMMAIALVTDTGRFPHPSTNANTLRVAADLVELGANLTELTNHIYYELGQRQFLLTHQVVSQAQIRAGGTLCMLLLRQTDLARFDLPVRDTEGLVDYSLSVKGVKVGALLKELGERKTKISLRSPDSIDVAKLARRYAGGGHKNAAGFMVDLPIDQAADFLEKEVLSLAGPASKGFKKSASLS
jgi:phosphoesterase RecJ-like protein